MSYPVPPADRASSASPSLGGGRNLKAFDAALKTGDPEQLARAFADAWVPGADPAPFLAALATARAPVMERVSPWQNELRDLEETLRLARPTAPAWTLRTAGFSGMQSLQTGDLILVRGSSSVPVLSEVSDVSAGAANSVYSHVLVARRDDHGKVWFIESKEPDGVRVTPASDELLKDSARTLVLRITHPPERERVQRHVEAMLPQLQARLPIPYNSWLDDDDPARFDCAELARHLLGPGFPVERTTLSPSMAAYARRAGMRNATMVLPGDFERDPRFTPVAEGLNPALAAEVRLREAAVATLFNLKEAGHDVLRPDAMSRAVDAFVTWAEDKGGRRFNSKVAGAALDLHRDMAESLAALTALQERMQSSLGRPATRREMMRELQRPFNGLP